jgi:hypothetical protein
MLATTGQQAIAAYLNTQADWRSQKAVEYPEDPRNLRCAEGLRELASYVLSLDPSDERIMEMTTLGVREGVFSPFHESAAYAVARFRFHRRDEDCGAFLTSLLGVMRDDALKLAKDQGALAGAER